jgi:antitoxin component YwqK of YwqJK toxin-antitoxin module
MIKYAILIGVLLIALFMHNPAFAQYDELDIEETDTITDDSLNLSIDEYTKYTPLLGGKEVRMKDGLKINGMIKDYYPDSTLKHKGYYQNGQLVSTYKNYFPNGKLERSFTASGTFKLVIESFFYNGLPREYVEYRKGVVVKYIEYHHNGKMATYEEHDKKKGYYISLKNYYSNGNLKSSLELIDKKKFDYYEKEFFKSGKIKEEGSVHYNAAQYDYQRNGEWKVYNEKGVLIETKHYYQGELIL